MAACSIDLITNTQVVGTTSTLIGTARVIPGTVTNFTFRSMMGTTSLDIAYLEVKRFTSGATVTTLVANGTLQDVTGSTIAIPADDWYDFYLSGSAGLTVSLVKGIRVTLT